jgi:hypothetical protein
MMEGRANMAGKYMRSDGVFPFGNMDLVGGGPTTNGYDEKQMFLEECVSAPKPNFISQVYDLFASGDFFLN